jgi:hypothetical protein
MIASLTICNAWFAGIILWSLYGRKQDPHQTYEDRVRQIRVVAQLLIMASILLSVFMAGRNLLGALALELDLELWHYSPLAYSAFLQAGLTAGLWFMRTVDPILGFNPASFEVYKAR